MLSLNKRINFVIPVEIKPGVTVYVHSTPIGEEVFESYFKVLAKAFTEMYAGGYSAISGPRIAKLLIKQISTDAGIWEGKNGVNAGLLGEIHRLTNVVAPTNGKGWGVTPYEDYLNQSIFDSDDVSEIENALCYFTLASVMHKKAELRQILDEAGSLWGARTELLDCMGLKDFLLTSTQAESIGEKAKVSSIPS